ncbi:hypothetical protein SUGI_1373730 [Cryptomeria japonica]|uniref:Uncharacterized protein n=1 Tax=Cryptomeria japonica TaxID=3369 RepID=A0AAD3NS79_CRYJA|nr:hypothetical protein SUGI_1373730 [Cryptomeria japonica]
MVGGLRTGREALMGASQWRGEEEKVVSLPTERGAPPPDPLPPDADRDRDPVPAALLSNGAIHKEALDGGFRSHPFDRGSACEKIKEWEE